MEKTNNENISPLIEFNVERVAKVLFALKDEDDLLYFQEDDFKLLDREGNLTSNYDENIFIQFAKGGAGGFGSDDIIKQFFPEEFKDNLSFFMKIAESLSDFKQVFLELASEKILNSKNFAKAIIQNCGSHYEPVLKYFPKEICKNKDILLSAVEKNGNNLKYASDELKKDREVVLAAIVPVLPFEAENKLWLIDIEPSLKQIKNGFKKWMVTRPYAAPEDLKKKKLLKPQIFMLLVVLRSGL